MAKGLALTVDGIPVHLQPQSNALYFPSGQAGLPTLRFELQLRAPLPGREGGIIHYADGNYADRLGWKEITAVAGAGAAIEHSSVPAQDSSQS